MTTTRIAAASGPAPLPPAAPAARAEPPRSCRHRRSPRAGSPGRARLRPHRSDAAAAAARPPSPDCDPHHYWEVAYERGTLGDDGIWRFPHRCRNCGLELLATDIADASAQAEQAAR